MTTTFNTEVKRIISNNTISLFLGLMLFTEIYAFKFYSHLHNSLPSHNNTSFEVSIFNTNLAYGKIILILLLFLSLMGVYLTSLSNKEKVYDRSKNFNKGKKLSVLIGQFAPQWFLGIGTLSSGLVICRYVFHLEIFNYEHLYIQSIIYFSSTVLLSYFTLTSREKDYYIILILWIVFGLFSLTLIQMKPHLFGIYSDINGNLDVTSLIFNLILTLSISSFQLSNN